MLRQALLAARLFIRCDLGVFALDARRFVVCADADALMVISTVSSVSCDRLSPSTSRLCRGGSYGLDDVDERQRHASVQESPGCTQVEAGQVFDTSHPLSNGVRVYDQALGGNTTV